ncbi:S9 family peptidase [Halobaculum gomorrense]|uniref:Acyl-peptide hydrolase n=1 Tax=Halobaculum gomorrense TaxID=43928 RepID=A0A1M5KF14_9EURY|nr:S9 family peptidase [Halobaculum gomorrense]SHG51524.1 Dipeptidyl aminopeptidase/acylaminoacyl peptidase [Halobaculum gomorrense]
MSDPTYDIERYLNVRSAHSAAFAPDGTLAFLMDTTGTPQVWSLDEAGAWPAQHTFYEERVTFVDWSPERRELAFGMDEGGNERMQLYRLDPDAGVVTEWTGMPDAKHRWGGWSHDGEQFAFASNRRDESVFDVYVQGRDETGDEAELVYEGDGWLSVAGWSPDDTRLLVHEAHASFDHDLHVLDVETGDLIHLTPHTSEARFQSPEWAPDGDGVYVCTDHASDTLRLERIAPGGSDRGGDGRGDESGGDGNRDGDAALGDLFVVEDGGDWNVDGVVVDEDTTRVAYSRNVDGYTEITVGEFTAADRIDPFAEAELPKGVAGGVSFGPDADRLAATVTGSTVNANAYVVDVKTGEASRWTHAATAGIPEETFVEPELVHYPTFDGREIPAFFSTPDDATDGETPVVVDIHGGPESQRRPSFNAVKQYFLNNGYGVFEPNVRGSSGYGKAYAHLDDVERRMDSVADIEAAVEWLHDHPAVDPDRIVAMGGSYGGFMVLAAMTEYPDLWAAGVDIVGIASFVTFLKNTGDWRRELREAEYGSLADDREFLESISPINHVDEIAAPLFVLHGANDPRVPVDEAEQIVEEASEHVPTKKLIFEDEGHGFSKLENRIEAYRAVVEFLHEHV